MAQATTSYLSPPGLEDQDAPSQAFATTASEVRAAALERIEEQLSKLGPNASRRDIIEAVRDAVLEEVDAKVQQKSAELWQRGKEMLNSIQQKQKEKTNKLTEEVAECLEKHRALEAENENLKQALRQLTARFSMLGAVFSGKGVSDVSGSGELSLASSPQTAAAVPEFLTPSRGPADVLEQAAEAAQKLPEVPAFPFGSAAAVASSAAPLSLAEALGTATPQRTPLSLVNSLTPTPELLASPFQPRSAITNGQFTFTLRKADGADLGLNVSHHESDKVLRVEGVRADGAVEAWNRQCATIPEKAVMIGDRIVSVNNVAYDPQKMLEECRDKQLLKLTIVRGDRPLPTMPAKAGPPSKPTTLRADASVFVPMGAEASKEDTAADAGAAMTAGPETSVVRQL